MFLTGLLCALTLLCTAGLLLGDFGGDRWLRLCVKVLCSLLFFSLALSAVAVAPEGPMGYHLLFLVAFGLSVAGDGLLDVPKPGFFLPGLAAFGLAQCAFAGALLWRYGPSVGLLAAWAVYLALAVLLLRGPGMALTPLALPARAKPHGPRSLPGGPPALRQSAPFLPYLGYAAALSAMAAAALSGLWRYGTPGAALGAVGGLLFFLSDGALCLHLFHHPTPRWAETVCLALYYPAQCLLALSLCV